WLFQTVGGGRLPIINITGGTEVGACLLSAFPTTPLKPCSLVAPSLGMAVDVYDADGRSLGPGQGVGELVCTKPWPAMTRGIWGDSERYIATYWSRWPDVWVHGDWASIDADGDWFLHGRSDDTIKVAGKRLGPAEVESVLNAHDAVSESAAVGVPHAVKGEVILGFVVTRPGCHGDAELAAELCAMVAEGLGHSFRPEAIRFVAELPKTRSGKILRRVIQRVSTGQEPGDLSTLENPAAVEAIRHAR
ncbi:MAG: acyl-CoA synthetase, partial [Isosphaeraceae bacterium]